MLLTNISFTARLLAVMSFAATRKRLRPAILPAKCYFLLRSLGKYLSSILFPYAWVSTIIVPVCCQGSLLILHVFEECFYCYFFFTLRWLPISFWCYFLMMTKQMMCILQLVCCCRCYCWWCCYNEWLNKNSKRLTIYYEYTCTCIRWRFGFVFDWGFLAYHVYFLLFSTRICK